MIEDLKADSARWENERRQQASARNSGGTYASRDREPYSRNSNTPPASYRNSEVHAHRRDYGPSDPGGYGDSHGYDNQPRYPGSGAPGYSGAAGNHSYGPGPQQGGYAGGPSAGAFPPPPNQYGQPAGAFPSTLPGADTRYATGASGGMNPPFGPQDPPYVSTGVSYAATSAPAPFPADTFGRTDPMVGAPRDRLGNNPATTVAQPRGSTYHTAGGPSGAYPGAATGGPYYPQAPPAAYPTQPLDPFHGRRPYSDSEPSPSALATSSPDYTMGGTNDAPYGYRGPHSVHDQYEDPSTQPRTASTGTSTQQVAANSGAPVRRNDRDRDRDRAERDREAERHAAERRHQHAARR